MSRRRPRHQPMNWRDSIRASDNWHAQGHSQSVLAYAASRSLFRERLGYVRNPRSLMEGMETLCRDDIGDLPGSPNHLCKEKTPMNIG